MADDTEIIARLRQAGRNDPDNAFYEAANRLTLLSRVVHNITPWLSASLSDETTSPCKEYRDACDDVFNADNGTTPTGFVRRQRQAAEIFNTPLPPTQNYLCTFEVHSAEGEHLKTVFHLITASNVYEANEVMRGLQNALNDVSNRTYRWAGLKVITPTPDTETT